MIQSVTARALPVALACAEAARGVVIPHFRTGIAAEAKADASPVTVADRACERRLRAIIADAFPDHAILGEEEGATGTSETGTSDWLWAIDPIDGTRAFLTGRPSFTTLVALFHKERPVLGVIDQPLTGERWIGRAGERTRFISDRLPGRIGARACSALARAELSCTAPEIFTPEQAPRFAALARHARRVSWGGDAYAYGLLALGQIDVIAEATMKPWDWGALVPVVEGAGGRVTDWSGAPLSLASDGTVLACGDPALLGQAMPYLSPKEPIG